MARTLYINVLLVFGNLRYVLRILHYKKYIFHQHTINTSKITNDTPKTDILYSDDYVWIESVNVFAKIKLACQNEGILFDLSRQELYQKLESEKLLITKDNRRSYEYRKGQFRQSVICLPRNNLNRHLAYDKEDIKL